MGGSVRYNVDGVIIHDEGRFGGTSQTLGCGYCQVFRNGVIETVDRHMLDPEEWGKNIVVARVEKLLLKAIQRYIEVLRELEVPAPLVVMVSLIGVKGYGIHSNRHWQFEPRPIDRDMLMLPDVFLKEYTVELPDVLRPMFNALWNAVGFPHNPDYKADGESEP